MMMAGPWRGGEWRVRGVQRQPRHLLAMLALSLCWAVVYFRHIGGLGLYIDDWSHLQPVATVPLRELIRTWPMDYRLFDMLPWWVLDHTVGSALHWYYGFLFAIGFGTAVLLYVLVVRLTGSALLALASSLLWSVFPADLSTFWLTSVHYRLGVFFVLCGLALLSAHGRHRRLCYSGALVCCVCILLCNELYLGILLSLPAVVLIAPSPDSVLARVERAAPFIGLMAAYVLYRRWLGPTVLHLLDNEDGALRLSIPTIVHTEVEGALTILLQSWQAAITQARHGLFAPAPATPHDARLLFTGGEGAALGFGPLRLYLTELYVLAAALGGALWLARRRFTVAWQMTRPGVLLMIVGLLGIVAGYLALAVTTDTPSLNGIDTRVNAAAMPGGALFIAGALWVLLSAIRLPGSITRLLFASGIVALAVVGGAWTERTASIYAEGWTTERQLWQALLTAAPALRPHTFLLLTASDARANEIIAAQQPWSVAGFLQLAYPRADISGDALPSWDEAGACAATGDTAHILPHALQPRLAGMYEPYRRSAPADQVVVVRYQGAGVATVLAGEVNLASDRCHIFSHADRVLHVPTYAGATGHSVAGMVLAEEE